MNIRSMKAMISVFEDRIIDMIGSGRFNVGAVIDFLNRIKPCDKWQIGSRDRIIAAVKNEGYTVSFDGHRYYIYK